MASFYQIEHSKSQLKYLKSDETRRDLPKRDTNSRNTMLRGENVIKFCRAPPKICRAGSTPVLIYILKTVNKCLIDLKIIIKLSYLGTSILIY